MLRIGISLWSCQQGMTCISRHLSDLSVLLFSSYKHCLCARVGCICSLLLCHVLCHVLLTVDSGEGGTAHAAALPLHMNLRIYK